MVALQVVLSVEDIFACTMYVYVSPIGLFSGLYAIHPFTGSGIPVYVANYVLSDYGTKAVMGEL